MPGIAPDGILARVETDRTRLEEAVALACRGIDAHADNPVFISRFRDEELHARVLEVDRLPRALALWGRTFAVKDNIDVEGLQTTAACPAFAYRPSQSAPSVLGLLDAGAIPIGKTNLDQFATGLVGTRSPYGACRNAFHPEYISGGSSSGSALAVALGMVDFALGTDTAGSGRVPAGFGNVVGLKPTRELVSRAGVVPACRSLDCVSVLAKTCGEALAVLEVMAGSEGRQRLSDARSSFDAASVRFVVPSELEFHGDMAYASLFARALSRLERLGGRRRDIDFRPFLEVRQLLYGPWVAERAASLAEHLPNMLPVTREIIASGLRYSAVDVFRAQHRLADLRIECEGMLGDADVLVVPTAPTIYRIAEVQADPLTLNSRLGHYTNFVNLLDMAAIAVPAGFREDGLPFGITLIGRALSDRSLARLGERFMGG